MNRLLRPRSIAVIGGKEAERVAVQCDRFGFAGEIWPVHPRRERLAGHAAFASVDDLPAAPDAAFVGVNRRATIDVVAALAARGAGGAVCYASGFGETGDEEGRALQRALVEAAGAMPVLGPNCYGFVNYLDGALLWPDQHGGARLEAGEGGAAIVTQSSNMAINLSMQRRGLPLAYLVTVGNQARIGLARMAEALLDDDRVTAIGLHVEGFGDARAFERLALRARERRVPVVVLKVGRSDQARATALTHTASLAGSDAISDTFLARLGLARVGSMTALLEALALLHVHGPLDGFDVASLSCSGGEACVMADAVAGTRLRCPAPPPEVRARVAAALGPLVTVSNPLDYHTFVWGDEARMHAAFTALLAARVDLAMLVADFPRADRCDDADWWPAVRAFERALADTGVRGALVATLPENLSEAHARDLRARGIAPLHGVDDAVAAIEAAARIGEAWRRASPAPLWPGEPGSGAALDLDEQAAKSALARYGVPVPRGLRAIDAAEALAAAHDLAGPVAVKALGVAHKTEVNGVRLGLMEPGEIESAARTLLATAPAVLVEEMIAGPVAELLVGVHREASLGLVLTLASGGVLVELHDDLVHLLLPCTADEIRAALAGLRCAALLAGHRGRSGGDVDAAVAAVMAVVRFAEAHAATLEELDVNPLIVRARGAVAVDAAIRLRETGNG